MKYQLGTITIRVSAEAFEDEETGEVTINGGAKPELSLHIDLPGGDPNGLAATYLRKCADSLSA